MRVENTAGFFSTEAHSGAQIVLGKRKGGRKTRREGGEERNFRTDSSSRAGSVSEASAYIRHPTLT